MHFLSEKRICLLLFHEHKSLLFSSSEVPPTPISLWLRLNLTREACFLSCTCATHTYSVQKSDMGMLNLYKKMGVDKICAEKFGRNIQIVTRVSFGFIYIPKLSTVVEDIKCPLLCSKRANMDGLLWWHSLNIVSTSVGGFLETRLILWSQACFSLRRELG